MIHGGDVYTEGLLKGRELLDYSSNINPLGLPDSFKNNLHKALDALCRYPDIQYRELKNNLSVYTNTKSDYFILGNGAAEIIDLSISSLDSVLIIAPSFGEYELSAKKAKSKIYYSYLKEEEIAKGEYILNYDYEDIFEKLSKVQGIVIANPNNPNGVIIDKSKFLKLLNYCEDKGKRVIVDEAFIEFVGDINKSLINYIEDYKCLFIIRALTKFFAMPGIRFGYGISSDAEYLKVLKDKQLPWNINSFAELAVQEVLKDEEYINKSLKWIEEERKFFYDALRELDIFSRVYKTEGNFILCKLSTLTDEKLYELLMEKALVIRKCGNYEGLNENYVRFAIKDRENNIRVLNILKSLYVKGVQN